MNIFATSLNPVASALWLDDVRKNKMILESAQLLSTTINVLHPTHHAPVYKTTHINHPCAIWARESSRNYKWLLKHLKALLEQWGTHKTSDLVPTFESFLQFGDFPHHDRTPFVNCTTNFKWVDDVHLAYRMQMKEKWETDTIHLSWNRGKRPNWYPSP